MYIQKTEKLYAPGIMPMAGGWRQVEGRVGVRWHKNYSVINIYDNNIFDKNNTVPVNYSEINIYNNKTKYLDVIV